MGKPFFGTDPRSTEAHKLRVVLVDDCSLARRALGEWLRLQFRVRIAGQADNGADGFSLAARLQPDLLITDFQMEGLDGLQLVALLRRQYPAMRTILTSAHGTSILQEASRQHGADAFVAKQCLAEELPRLLPNLFPELDSVCKE